MTTERERWERLEKWLFDNDKDDANFTVGEYAAASKSTADTRTKHLEASKDIQTHLRAQRAKKSLTLFVLHRLPGTRTRSARWGVGAKTKNADLIGNAFYDDVLRKAMRAFEPDLRRIEELNPRAGRRTRLLVKQTLGPAMEFLSNAVTSELDEE